MPSSINDELTRLRIILRDLEDRLAQGEVAPEGLPEFKSTVDEIRMRVWGLLTAAGAEAPRAVAERFRLRRAAEMCRELAHELEGGLLDAMHPEWLEVQQTAVQLGTAVAQHAGRAA